MEPNDIFSTLYPAEVAEKGAFPGQTPVGMAYVPMQKIGIVYEPSVAYKVGTLYPDLDKPFLGGGLREDE